MYIVPHHLSLGGSLGPQAVDLAQLVLEDLGHVRLGYYAQGHWMQCYDMPVSFKCMDMIHEHFSDWPIGIYNAAMWFFTAHTHLVYVVSLSIFFGPIAILIPLLLLHELVVAILFNLSFISHGLLRGTVDDHYLYLHSFFDDLKGFTFSHVDRLGAKYNKLTTKYWPLVIFRLVSLCLGGLALYCIASGR